jgi:formate-nitrite transporter family protein
MPKIFRKSGDRNPASAPAIKDIEEKQVQQRVAIGAHVVHETIRREGESELKRSTHALAWSGLAAGLSMGFSLVGEGLLTAYLPHAAWVPLLTKLGYSVGFLIVVLGRQQLYTETTLTAVLPFLENRKRKMGLQVLRLWSTVFVANLVGTYLFALCVAHVHMFSPHIHDSLLQVSRDAVSGSFGMTFIRAIFAGWLIALMVWLLPGA